MRASDLLGREVRDADNQPIGRVIDLRATLDGHSTGTGLAPRVTALVISKRHVGTFLGYQQPDQRGPWLIRSVIALLHRGNRLVDWTEVATHDGPHIVLRATATRGQSTER